MTRDEAIERILDPQGLPADAVERAEVDAWLERDAGLRAMYEDQQEVWAAMDAWTAAPPSESFDQQVFARIEREEARRRAWWTWLTGPRLAVAATLAAALVCVWLVGARWIGGDSESLQTTQAASQEAFVGEVQYSAEIDLALDDLEMLMDFEAFPEAEPEGRS